MAPLHQGQFDVSRLHVGPQVKKVMARRAADKGTTLEEDYRLVARDAALRYIPSPSEYAKALVFFAYYLSGAVTGQSLHVIGGLYVH